MAKREVWSSTWNWWQETLTGMLWEHLEGEQLGAAAGSEKTG